MEFAELAVTEEEIEWRTEGEAQFEQERNNMNLEQGREEEMNDMLKTLGMFEFGSWAEATPKAGPKAGKVKKDDDGREVVRCRTSARDFKLRREGARDDLFAAMPIGGKESAVCIRCTVCAKRDEDIVRTK